ncbi:ACS family tartrate transporter-like MFS transporter [Paraburkholderia sp. GV068]|uniref:MFS transporter n=1 Tax=Paraburkholderia TaxID=1822464 RepID=UPI000D321607|nr:MULTISPECIES: MFS transporter [unclassified Paraburkholderia]PTQ93048.1 ACS family tartrate transporter-like MFS transporter [Paraburkholderia sp. GV072]PUA99779.1 ACS family tartrate transporter-like MFS transporter [Paraburkholderia sp. GV068]
MKTASIALETRVFRKLLLFIMPAMLIAFMDRINISFAAPTMNKAIALDPKTFGLGAGIFFVGYLLFEIPSNMVLARVGARFWISRIMIVWGLAAMAMTLAVGPMSFVGLRFLLGVAEAGFLPGVMLYASYWISGRKLGAFTSLMLLMIPIAGSVTALLSGLVLKLDGWLGLAGWQWIFLTQGAPAVLLGLYGLVYLPSRPGDARWLSDSEKTEIEARVRTAADTSEHRSTTAFRNRKTWIYAGAYFFMNLALGAQPWLPLLFAPLHLTSLQVALLLAGANGLAAGAMVVWGRKSDAAAERPNHLLVSAAVATVGWFLCGYAADNVSLLSFGVVLALVGMYASLVVFWTLPTTVLRVEERPIGIAMVTCVGLIGSFAAPTITGHLKELTGTYQGGMYMAACGMIFAALVARAGKNSTKSLVGNLGREH